MFSRSPSTFGAARGTTWPSGFGIHQCIGQPLARTELRVALTELAHRFPGLALAAPAGELAMRSRSLTFGLENLPVKG